MEIYTPELDKIEPIKWILTVNYSSLQKVEINDLIGNHVWVTASKRKISVREMETSHINNTIKCWNSEGLSFIPEGYLGGREKWLKIFKEELLRRQ